jgi:hypothetical protein
MRSKELSMQKPLDFKCPHCATAYQVVKVQTDTYTDAEIDCLVCGQALQAGDDHSFFKYFLVDPPRVSRQQLLALYHDEVCKLGGAGQ